MMIKRAKGPVFVTLRDGTIISRADLPDPKTRRWVASRKAAVVRAVAAGLITVDEACAMYALSPEEFQYWQSAVEQHGIEALKTTYIGKYRQP